MRKKTPGSPFQVTRELALFNFYLPCLWLCFVLFGQLQLQNSIIVFSRYSFGINGAHVKAAAVCAIQL